MLGAIDATSKHGEGQSRVEAEVEECVPAFPAYPDGTVGNRGFTLKTTGSEKSLEIRPLSMVGTVGSQQGWEQPIQRTRL